MLMRWQVPLDANSFKLVDVFLQDPPLTLYGNLHDSMGRGFFSHGFGEELQESCYGSIFPRCHRGSLLLVPSNAVLTIELTLLKIPVRYTS